MLKVIHAILSSYLTSSQLYVAIKFILWLIADSTCHILMTVHIHTGISDYAAWSQSIHMYTGAQMLSAIYVGLLTKWMLHKKPQTAAEQQYDSCSNTSFVHKFSH